MGGRWAGLDGLALFAGLALGLALGAAALGAVLRGGGLLFGCGFRDRGCGGVRPGVRIWSGRLEVFGTVRCCQVLFDLVGRLEAAGEVEELLRGELGERRRGGGGERFGGAEGEQVEVERGHGRTGALAEFAEGEALFAEEGDDGGAVLPVDVLEAVGGDGRCVVGLVAGVVGGAERAVDEELFEEGVEREGVVDGEGLGEGASEVGVVVVEVLEVVVDGGVGDVELFGDLAEGVALVVEQLGVDDACAALCGELHVGAPVLCCGQVFC